MKHNSILVMEVAFAYYKGANAATLAEIVSRNSAQAVAKIHGCLCAAGILTIDSVSPLPAVHTMTEKGYAWIGMLLATPFPEKMTIFVDPRTSDKLPQRPDGYDY